MLATSDRPIVHQEETVLAHLHRREALRAVPLVTHTGMLLRSGVLRSAAPAPLPGPGVLHPATLVEQHTDQQREGVVVQQRVGGGILDKCSFGTRSV